MSAFLSFPGFQLIEYVGANGNRIESFLSTAIFCSCWLLHDKTSIKYNKERYFIEVFYKIITAIECQVIIFNNSLIPNGPVNATSAFCTKVCIFSNSQIFKYAGGCENKYKDKTFGAMGYRNVLLYRRRLCNFFSARGVYSTEPGGENGAFSNDAIDLTGRISIYFDSIFDGFFFAGNETQMVPQNKYHSGTILYAG
jgi:hypothetical protein